MILLIFILTSLSLLTFVLLTKLGRNGSNPSLKHPPGPKGLPILGNFHQFKTLSTHLYFHQLSKAYGPIVYLKLGFIPAIVVSTPELAKEVLRNQDHIFCSRQPLAAQRKLSYNGLDVVFSPFNDYWREMRKICITQLFSPKKVQSFSYVRQEEVGRILNEISSLASASKVVNLSELVMSLSTSIIGRIAFGKNSGDDENYRRTKKLKSFLNRAQHMFMSLFFSGYFPYMGWLDMITGASQKLERLFIELDEFYQELIDEHLEPNESNLDRKDIIDVLLQLRKERSMGIDLTMDHVKAVLMNIFIEGTETTLATIIWTMTELMKNPKNMKRAQEEVRALIKVQEGSGFIKEEDLDELVYLKAAVKEIFRIHPAVPLLVPHQTLQNCTLQGYQIEAGTLVFVNVWAIGRDPKSWEEPDRFMPERFLGSDIDFRGRDFKLIPFGAGRRICPGLRMGVLTVEIALANLLCWFDWEMPDGMRREDINMDELPGITVLKKDDLCLCARSHFCSEPNALGL